MDGERNEQKECNNEGREESRETKEMRLRERAQETQRGKKLSVHTS